MDKESLYALFRARQSDRKFDLQRDVDAATVKRIVEGAITAPSAVNQQPYSVIAVSDRAEAAKIGQAALKGVAINKFVATAPAHLFIIAERSSVLGSIGNLIRNINFVPFDIGIFMAYLCLAAEAEGLGSCIIGSLNGNEVARQLGVPKSKRVVFDIVLGYSTEVKRDKKRRALEEVLHTGRW